jgi:recombinational DNA repair ATPase RecF
MLSTVAVRGYRSLRDLVLPLDRMTVVTGANGTGKSSVYRALRLLADCGRGELTTPRTSRPRSSVLRRETSCLVGVYADWAAACIAAARLQKSPDCDADLSP